MIEIHAVVMDLSADARVAGAAGLRLPGNAAKDVELLVLRQQLAVLQRLLGEPRLEPADRALLTALSRLLPRQSWSSFFVTPATLLRRHRELIVGKCPHRHKSPGRPPRSAETPEPIPRLAREGPLWGHRRVPARSHLRGGPADTRS
ncbi:hypothetical protein [Streptomyces barringtoniae]|uniref:hypothetical protein n=1 Tax=Streptomyces barringtoniae TaxID=2892029 RepID=UPI001E312FC5|nr:hypothetical protein [Streptomyces barringtoniae]MCC5476492.1 hypothetical protein [Streptomyces barringtoniae]